ncbi:MAG: hypothetical protein R3C25_13930 [Hyphomonadaceae bacterium]
MSATHAIGPNNVGRARRRSALSRALGETIADALAEADVVEALINADGRVWLDRLGRGLERTGASLSAADRETAIRLLAHEAGDTVGEHRASLSAILPDSAARIQALMPPLVEAPIIAIRKRPSRIYALSDYVTDGIASDEQAKLLAGVVAKKHHRRAAPGRARPRS